jgi:hypothetical protein
MSSDVSNVVEINLEKVAFVIRFITPNNSWLNRLQPTDKYK